MKDVTLTPWYPLKVFLGIIGYLGFIATASVFFCVGLPLFLLLTPWPALMRRLMYSVLKGYAFALTRLWLPGLGVYRFLGPALLRAEEMRGCVVVANHRSRLDALLLLAMLPRTGVVIKSKYAGTPPFSAFVKYLDFVSIDPDSLSSIGEAVKRCGAVLASGKNLLVFPEGTRAKTGRLLAFGPFAFKIAAESGAAVLPAVLHSDLPLMARRSGSIFPVRKFAFTVRFLAPCRREPHENTADFAARVRGLMAEELAQLDTGTCWDPGRKDGERQ